MSTNKVESVLDYRKLNVVMKNDHFSLIFIDRMLDILLNQIYFYFLYQYMGYNRKRLGKPSKFQSKH